MPNNTFSFYFNYDYGRTPNKTIDKESSVKHIVDIFYKQYFGKIINVTDMKSECGSFFIITFNKDTWNWGNSIAYRLYNTGFENNETLRHKMINECPITFTNPNGDEWQIFLTTFPNFTVDTFGNFTDLIGECTYDIMWDIQEYGEESDNFKINKRTTNNNNFDVLVNNDIIENEYLNKLGNNKGTWWTEEEWDNNENMFDEKGFYENWANELDHLSSGKYDNSYDETWKPIEYRYDLCDISYNMSFPHLNDIISNQYNQGVVTENGYIVYNNCEFISYYGREEGEKRWNSNIYSAPCFSEDGEVFLDPPIGCQFIYNISYLVVKCCLKYNNETDFNMNRAIIRKYVDILWSFTDATDETYEQKPTIKLRADYNNETFNISCWHTFQYTNLKGEKKQNIEKIIRNFKSYDWYKSNVIDWIPSA